MKVCVIQPPYSLDFSRSDELFQWELDALEKCDPSMDLIVLPEYSNAPALVATREELLESYHKYTETLLAKCSETAKRCEATLFVCCIYPTESGLRNTTVAFDKTGKEAGHYYKQHLVRSEMYGKELDKDYTWEFSEPTILDVDGVRYGFLICYDAYFYELFPNIARHNPDVIISCAHQRSDSHAALEIMSQFCAYNTNAYLIRSS
ncbi:MAG: carbon-nitrogen hydrolase family protein, partial [Ruminococcaceae bacterium]|nr:carbon-nitrogen hydrolase family protein [Oscillospiraceae bacterium]